MNRRTYAIVVLLFSGLAIVSTYGIYPLKVKFARDFMPALFLVHSLEWLLLNVKKVWKAVLFGLFLSLYIIFVTAYWRGPSTGIEEFAALLIIFLAVQSLIFFPLSGDTQLKLIWITMSLGTIFIVLSGLVVVTQHIENHLPVDNFFLFGSPLVAMSLSVFSAATRWRNETRVTFIVLIVQVGIGVFDTAQIGNLSWMSMIGVLIGLSSLGFVVLWAKELNTWMFDFTGNWEQVIMKRRFDGSKL